MSYKSLIALLDNLASIIIPLFAHRFSNIGSLYNGPPPEFCTPTRPSSMPTPTPSSLSLNFSSLLTPTPTVHPPRSISHYLSPLKSTGEFHVGPIVSWPFFGSNRGDLVHPTEIDLGPWPTTRAYFQACVDREIQGVIRENEGKAAPHRLHLDPDEIQSSRHHHLQAVPGDRSDDSDEWDIEESEEEWDGPGDMMYRDYRRHQRSTFLIAHMNQREQSVREEMGRWKGMMEGLITLLENPSGRPEQFSFDLHDLSLENIFVDSKDHSKIVSLSPRVSLWLFALMLTINSRHASLTGSRQRFDRSGSVRIYQPSSKQAHSFHDASAMQSSVLQNVLRRLHNTS
jgi:hypothetical protein